ncbi:Aste57867_21525 [Aphanomyces stellatus]|uniref:Aste57867_21525 protein n=1 Tax=Aphanomyces stellatus TaxID=120398 RepID=A0A485LMK7_9STRA|nr:hypothetical protein As57867_021456 [Aphanomyces stellatus]VFT98195.1 Aste57867_21525 [Aphanomyces stellatus]
MVNQFEAELNEDVYVDADVLRTKKSTFSGHASLLQADEVTCSHMIGRGDSGIVYKGTYRGSIVVEKRMHMSVAKPSESMEKSLEIVASRMSSLRHPNTVLFMGVCLRDQEFCIVSEYCSRGSLYDILHSKQHRHGSGRPVAADVNEKETDLHWSLRCRLALGAARGLLFLHSASPPLVHAQLTSANILVDDSWNAKLADFGTRKVSQAVSATTTKPKDKGGRLPYWSAPEVLKNGEAAELTGENPQGVDVYSFGIVLWELATGEIPFANLATYAELRSYVLSGQRPSIKAGACPMAWTELMAKCWSNKPQRRPSAAEIVTLLEAMSQTEPMMQKKSPSSRKKKRRSKK